MPLNIATQKQLQKQPSQLEYSSIDSDPES